MIIRWFLLTCTLGLLVPLSAIAAETGAGPRFEVERDWSGELRPRYRGPQAAETGPSAIPPAAPPAAPKIEMSPPAKPRAQARIEVTKESPGEREHARERDAFAWQGPSWETDDRRTGPKRAWSERERREREWRERKYAELDRREQLTWRRDQRYDFRDEDEIYWEDCDPDWDRC